MRVRQDLTVCSCRTLCSSI